MQVQLDMWNTCTVDYYSGFRASNNLSSAEEVGLDLFILPGMGDDGWVGAGGLSLFIYDHKGKVCVD
jgi:hypothetical protein